LVTQGSILYASTEDSGVFRSTDSGASWTPANTVLADTSLYVSVAMGEMLFAIEWKHGVLVSKDSGVTWVPCNNGLLDTSFLVLAESGGILFAGSEMYGMFRSTDSGNSWMADDSGITDSVITAENTVGGYLFAGTDMGSVFFSSDSGMSWSLDTQFWNFTVTSFAQVGTHIIIGTEGAVFFSADSGKSWERGLSGISILVRSLLEYNGSLFASVGVYPGQIWLSTDSGKGWSDVTYPYILGQGTLPLIVNGSYLIAGDYGIWRRSLSQIIPGPAYITIFPDTLNFGGQYYYSDSALTCGIYNGGSGIDTIDSVRIVGADYSDFYVDQYPQSIVFPLLIGQEDTLVLPIGYLPPQIPGTDTATLEFFYSHSKDSVLTVHLSGSSVTDDVSGQQMGILSNATAYPNPTGEGTVISFGISQEAYVKIELFDILGHEVDWDGRAGSTDLREPGNTSVPISLAGLNSGSYFARIVTNYGEVETVKIVKE
jgi:hypothetical protein